MNKQKVKALMLALLLIGTLPASKANAYGSEGLFGGRAAPDGSLLLENPTVVALDRPDRVESILMKARPDYDATPLQAGGFEFYPTVELDTTYDSNIYASHDTPRDDLIGTVRPIMDMYSNWAKHAVSMTAFGDINTYNDHSKENYQNGVIDINGRYDLENDAALYASAGYQHLIESRFSPDAVDGSEPTTFNVAKSTLGAEKAFGNFGVKTAYELKRFDYDNTPSSYGMIEQSGRNRTEHAVSTTFSYRMNNALKPYVRGAYFQRNYDHNTLRDSTGYGAYLGAIYDYNRAVSVDFFGGWREQNYDNFLVRETVATPTFGGTIDWNLTDKTSLALEGSRTIEETTLDTADSYTQTGGSATLTHELRENILLEADASYSHYRFNDASKIEDDSVLVGTGIRYLINTHLYSDLTYSWNRRYSTESYADYQRHYVTLRIGVHM